MNGETLKTLRELSQKEKISASVGIPILLGAMADVTVAINGLSSNQESSRDERARMSMEIGKLSEDVKELSVKVDGVNTDLSQKVDGMNGCFKALEDKISKNPAVKAGIFIQNYKWISTFLGITLIVLLTAWTLPGVRIGVMEWIGMPDAWIAFLNP